MNLSFMLLSICALVVPGAPTAAQESAPDWSLRVEARERVQYLNNSNFDALSENEGWLWTQRLAISSEGEIAPKVRARLNVQSALKSGPQNSPVESNVLDVREVTVDIGTHDRYLRLGRQDLAFGSQRLIGTRDGTNVRRAWDGARLRQTIGGWVVDGIAVKSVSVKPEGVFNDRADEGRILAGIYANKSAENRGLDLYLLYTETDDRSTIEGLADQRRYSAGLRGYGQRGKLFWNWEAIYQWGRQGDFDISAWTLATNTGWQFEGRWSPRIMISANVASGDDQVGDGKLGTFDALYPRGNYFSDAAILGPANFYNFNPYLTLSPTDRLTLKTDVNWFWRLESEDGIYSAPGNLLRRPGAGSSRFVATGISAGATYQINEQVSAELIYAHNAPGNFISETGASDPVDFLELTLRFTL